MEWKQNREKKETNERMKIADDSNAMQFQWMEKGKKRRGKAFVLQFR